MPSLKRKPHSSNAAITRVDNPVPYASTSTILKQNQLQATVKLLDASENIEEFVSDTKSILSNIRTTNKKLYSQLTTIVNHFEHSVGSTLKDEIIPNMNSCGSPMYVLQRLRAARKSGTTGGGLSNALISPRHARKLATKRIYLLNRRLPTRRLPTCQVKYPTPSNGIEFKPEEAFKTYIKLGKYKTKCLNEWRKNKYIPGLSTFFRRLREYKTTAVAPSKWQHYKGRPPIVPVNKVVGLTTSPSVW